MGHRHGASELADPPLPQAVRRGLAAAVLALTLVALVGVVVLWPTDVPEVIPPEVSGADTRLVHGTVRSSDVAFCEGTDPEAGILCIEVQVELTSGPNAGRMVSYQTSDAPATPIPEAGDKLVLGYVPSAPEGQQYFFADFQRDTPMLVLGLLFAVAVVALGRLQGVRALAALAVTLAVLVGFIIPALLDGRSPTAVAVVGSLAVLLIALYLSHGLNVRTSVAVIGTAASLGLIALLAAVFTGVTHLTGLASEEAVYLRLGADTVSLTGLLLAGIVIGALGVLDDVTVTQTSAVWELHAANPDADRRRLFTSALQIGRDHIASTVNTLVLAYAGASLPLLLLFQQSGRSLRELLTSEVVAVEVIRTLVGSIGLVAAVPLTTVLAVSVVTAGRPADPFADAHDDPVS
jgi:uncharacterized membrane protein